MENNLTDKIIYDWLSFTVHGDFTPKDVMQLLGMSSFDWLITKGARGYRQRYYFDCISIHFDGVQNSGVWCEMSGQGCRAFETFGHGDFDFLFDFILQKENNAKITRLDVACDDHSGMLDIDKLCEDTLLQNYVSRFDAWEVLRSNKGSTVYLGSHQSDTLLRIYDKARERGFEDGKHWIRVEFQLRDDRALQYIKQQKKFSSGVMFALALNNYVRFVVPSENDTNKSRWQTAEYWDDFLNNISERISIYEKPKIDYNLKNLENYVINMAGNAVDTFIKLFGTDGLINYLENREIMPNPKYEELLKRNSFLLSLRQKK